MFLPGTRLKIYTSSFTGKKLGPRKNSIGYFVSANPSQIVLHDNAVYFLSPLRITFLKYGNESRTRAETKTAISVLPLFVGQRRKDPPEVFDYLYGQSFVKDPFWKVITAKHRALATGIILPAKQKDEIDFENFKAWIYATTKNNLIFKAILNGRQFSKITEMRNEYKDLLDQMYHFVRATESRRKFLEQCKINEQYMVDLIQFMQVLTAVVRRHMSMADMRSLDYLMTHYGQHSGLKDLIEWQTRFMFEDRTIFAEKNKLLKKYNRKIASKSDVIEATRTLADTRETLITKYI